MDKSSQHTHSHLFTLRVWEEEVSAGQREWRGKVQLVTRSEVRYLHHWTALVPLLVAMLSEVTSQVEPNP